MKNYVFDCERMKYPFTGLYQFCLELGTALQQEIDKESEQLYYYVRKKEKAVFGKHAKYLLQNSLQKFLMPGFKGVDLWHCTYQNSNYFPFRTKAKIVFTVHDLNFLHEDIAEEKRRRICADLQKKIDRADYITAISRFTLNDIKYNLNLADKKTAVIYNGCNLPEIENPDKPGYVPSSPFIYSVGTIHPKKNFHVLIPLLEGNDYQLIISGVKDREDYWNKIKSEAELNGLASRVILTGAVSGNDKTWYLQNCSAFAFPSIAEGFGLPVIEAMQFGKPVFISDKTCLPEIGGEYAFYFSDFEAEAMRSVFNRGMHTYQQKPELKQQLIDHAGKFSWRKSAEAYLDIYRELCP
jgi:glycosyltransferase involved in cell wall biosynthesis